MRCVLEMKRTGSSMRRSAVRAPRPPRSERSSKRDLRPMTSAYSAATKKALPRTNNRMTTMRRKTLTRSRDASTKAGYAPAGAPVLGGISSPTRIRSQYR